MSDNSSLSLISSTAVVQMAGRNVGTAPSSADASEVWGSLRREGGTKEEYELFHRIKNGIRDQFVLGRNKAFADVVADHKLISSKHCSIYCDYSEVRLRIFIEDSSVNGTFINNPLTRLSRGERIELMSGDVIYLLSPRDADIEKVKACSFTFINIRERRVAQRVIGVAPSLITGQIGRGRHIEDFYIIGNQIGAGVSGQVHFCVNRSTNQPCAVKIIDTRKFTLDPSLSIDTLKEEAEIMSQLDHVSDL